MNDLRQYFMRIGLNDVFPQVVEYIRYNQTNILTKDLNISTLWNIVLQYYDMMEYTTHYIFLNTNFNNVIMINNEINKYYIINNDDKEDINKYKELKYSKI
ncbi:Hypothetical protein ORPV_491 [Orpheovirus IHUMI-LCC2]|uniref:Uncharacterized protein n=1 Tax=Orpheovirus IHUMI-LCC2 TaxID=2023057 RepID=A0A2I2L4B7_9VIRU|nr:Hypothetical protein ORPV_491 [Orpheovirus IHUMI-LCC2]SNW62395.1 Hypothetical protein ORPV_491 [Orpheovirus IHUMI-LCC2]